MKTTSKIIKRVAFFGDADIEGNSETFKLAYETGKVVAQAGYIIVNGGGPGVMWAGTKGAKEVRGIVELVVLAPTKQPKNYEGVFKQNLIAADKVITTNNYSERLNKLIEIADAFVIFKGGTGTLSEVGMVWEMAKFEYGHHEPLIFVGKEWKEIVNKLMKNMNYEEKEKRVVMMVETPEEVLEVLKK